MGEKLATSTMPVKSPPGAKSAVLKMVAAVRLTVTTEVLASLTPRDSTRKLIKLFIAGATTFTAEIGFAPVYRRPIHGDLRRTPLRQSVVENRKPRKQARPLL